MVQRFYHYLLQNQIIFALFLVVTGWLLFQTRGIIVTLFIAYIINASLLPVVNSLQKRGVPHILSVIIPFLGSLLFITLIIFPLIPFIANQVTTLLTRIPDYLGESASIFGMEIDVNRIQSAISNELDTISRNAFTLTSRVFGGIFSTLTVLIISFYLLLDHENLKKAIARSFHRDERPRVLNTLEEVDSKLGAWLRGQMSLSLIIGVVTWIALTLLGVPFALPLAILAGLLEIVPTLGPILASIPAIIVAITVSPALTIAVAILYIMIQLVENNFLVPKIMQRAVGLNPIIVIVAVTIGASLMGVIGALLSIPFVTFLIVIFHSLNTDPEDK